MRRTLLYTVAAINGLSGSKYRKFCIPKLCFYFYARQLFITLSYIFNYYIKEYQYLYYFIRMKSLNISIIDKINKKRRHCSSMYMSAQY